MEKPASTDQIPHLKQTYVFDEGNPLGEKNTFKAAILTALMMIIEIIGGWIVNSMALLADGWHMSSHALALGLSVLAYKAARHYKTDQRFAFGTWKIEVLGGYTSAMFLVFVAGLMLYQSVERLLNPGAVHYNEAIIIAIVGLLVNFACAWLLKEDHAHHHHHGTHEHHHEAHNDHHHDVNLRSAYLHVLADAATSVLAILALIGGKYWGWTWLDPIMGIAGAALVGIWAYGLVRDTGKILLDAGINTSLAQAIQNTIRHSPIQAQISDLRLWQVGKSKYACILILEVKEEATPLFFKQQLSLHPELAHITIEVNQ
jgi:cation diffusion facilitator family transporter